MCTFPFQIVGFDLDGTLVDTLADLGNAVNHALDLAGRPPVPLSGVADLVGGGARKMLERAFALTGGIADEDFQPCYRALLAYYEANIAVHSRLFPGGAAMLNGLAECGVRLAVVTNKAEALAVSLLGELGLSARFALVLGGDTLGPGRAKPAPDMIHEMIERLGGGAGTGIRAAFVGDTTYDILAARAAGVPSVAVSFGFNDKPPSELGADAVIGHFSELIPTLLRL
ncbi:MAG: HAD hydrolase-like protein [Novosphingobium sp.]